MTSMRKRSLAVFPAASNGEFNLPDDMAMVIAGGEGCRLWDTDGRDYIDFSMGWGSSLPGHAHPEIVAAVRRQAERGSSFAYVSAPALALAEEIVRLSPAADRVRFCASGTEATMYCQRLARAFTGKPKILKFEGAYHGANELGVTSLFPHDPPDFPAPDPTSAGIEPLIRDTVLVAPYNDLDVTGRIIDGNAEDLAAVIVEPLHRCTPPEPGFLEGLRKKTREHGVLLIFDEVVTGFRLAYGGAQAYYGVVPDLVAYGKALGGGYPLAAFAGRADIMDLVREDRMGQAGYVWVASTLGGNPVSAAAAGAALAVYRSEGTYERLFRLGASFRQGLHRVLAGRQIAAQVLGDGPMAQVAFSAEAVRDYRSGQRADAAKGRRLMLALFRRGVFLNPMGTKLYLSLAHDEAVCEAFLDRMDDALQDLG